VINHTSRWWSKLPNQLLPRARRRGASGGDRRERGVRAPPAGQPNLARRGEIATKTQKLTPIFNCETLPKHVHPLARFGAPPTYVTAAWCEPIAIILAR
jgi:hypothetical protein